MGLNPHLINLMTIRERQNVHRPPASGVRAGGAAEFKSALKESISAEATLSVEEGRAISASSDARADAVRHMAQTGISAANPSLTAEKILSVQSLVGRFLSEQDLVLAAQSAPTSRYRNTPDDDTSGELETQANLRPVS